MFAKNVKDCQEFVAGDNTLLREVIHPKNDGFELAYSLAYSKLRPGQTSLPHKQLPSEVYYVLSGHGMIYVNSESRRIFKGSVVYVPSNARQHVKNTGNDDLEFLCIVSPPWKQETEELVK